MTYEKLKAFDLNDIKSQEQADDFKAQILESDRIDILKYINFLRWQQFSSNTKLNYINRIVNILSFDELIEIESENSDILTGDVEDLVFTVVVETEEILNPITIGENVYSVMAVLEDDFESVMIVKSTEISEGEVFDEETAKLFITTLNKLFIPMDMNELSKWSNKQIKENLDCVETLIKEEKDKNFVRLLVEVLLKTATEEVAKNPVTRTDVKPLQKFGFIVTPDLHAYELYEEPQEFYQKIIDAQVGTKVNVYADIVGENQVTKTFKKVDLVIEDAHFNLCKKTNKGVLTPVNEAGMFSVLKKEELIANEGINVDRLKPEEDDSVNIMGMGKMKTKDFLESLKGFSRSEDEEDCDYGNEEDDEEDEIEYTKEDFADNFKFSKPYQFSFMTPDENESSADPLTETTLFFHGTELEETDYNDVKWCVSDRFVGEVYRLLAECFGICEETDGEWNIPNSKLERVMRKLTNAGGVVHINSTNAGAFLQRFLRDKKLERVLKNKMNIQVVKKITTKKDIDAFAKDAGTELYVQMNQVLTAILEGTKRIYGENHIVFDSDNKVVICQCDKLDLVDASNYAIDNEYHNFYVIEKDSFQQYDAYYKESIQDDSIEDDISNENT